MLLTMSETKINVNTKKTKTKERNLNKSKIVKKKGRRKKSDFEYSIDILEKSSIRIQLLYLLANFFLIAMYFIMLIITSIKISTFGYFYEYDLLAMIYSFITSIISVAICSPILIIPNYLVLKLIAKFF